MIGVVATYSALIIATPRPPSLESDLTGVDDMSPSSFGLLAEDPKAFFAIICAAVAIVWNGLSRASSGVGWYLFCNCDIVQWSF